MQSITTSVLARILLSALLALSFTMSVCAQTNTKTKVACIGDSLTRGYLLEDAQSYPAQLQQLLGAQYEVRNFGHTSSYVIDDGPVEYRNTEDYSAAIQYDAAAQAPWFRYRDDAGALHEVWFEDARSIRARLRLVPEYGLRGIFWWNMNRLFRAGLLTYASLFDTAKIF